MNQLNNTPKWAVKVATQINTNVEDVDAGRITWEEFSARQLATWGAVTRGELNVIGSACHRRFMAVQSVLNGVR